MSLRGEDPMMFRSHHITRGQDNCEILNKGILCSQSEFYGGL
jgi:hypothetical protein